jgi:AcrR family transcriptional regulator
VPRRPPGADAMSVWLRPAQVTRQPAPAFSREEITWAAIELADHGGLEAVSMRRIAARIGSAPTSLYWYFSDKDELYELMVDAVIGEVQLPERPSGDWRADLRCIAMATWAAMSSHPWFARLGIHPVAGPQTVRFGFGVLIARARMNGELACGRGNGFDLHQLAGVAEYGHAEQRTRCVMITEGRLDDLPRRDEIGPPDRGHEHGGLEHIGESGTASGQGGTEIHHGHPGLRPDIVAADDAPAFVQRARAGGENQRARRGGGGIRIGNTRVQTVRTDQADGHGRSLPAAPAGDFRARGPSYWDT